MLASSAQEASQQGGTAEMARWDGILFFDRRHDHYAG